MVTTAVTQQLWVSFAGFMRDKEQTSNVLSAHNWFITNHAEFARNIRFVTDLLIVDATHGKKSTLQRSTRNITSRINVGEPCHVVVEILCGTTFEMLHSALEAAVVGIDALDMMDAP